MFDIFRDRKKLDRYYNKILDLGRKLNRAQYDLGKSQAEVRRLKEIIDNFTYGMEETEYDCKK